MDQASFRQLLQSSASPTASTPAANSRSSFFTSPKKPAATKTKPASEPAFKPRKVKKPSNYRNRAEERRLGREGDYAQVEAVLEDFERQNAESEDKDAVEDKRRYLGGDSDHSILVKGLDYALLEQNKARLASDTSKQDDDLLETVFAETSSVPAASTTAASKKRSRADIINELKAKRAGNGSSEGDAATAPIPAEEKPLAAGRFKPIGFNPIGAQAEQKGKKKKSKGEAEGGERKKKKRKVDTPKESIPPSPPPTAADAPPPTSGPSTQTAAPPQPQAEPEAPVDEGFDIFAGAGDYQGLQVDSDDDDDDSDVPRREPTPPPASIPGPRKGWFDDEPEPTPPPSAKPSPSKSPAKSRSPPPVHDDVPMEDEEEEQPTRLAPLASSALPSIKDFLATAEAAEKESKRRARKQKQKAKAKGGGDDSE